MALSKEYEEIALRVWKSQENAADTRSGEQIISDFVESFLAALPKPEPVAWVIECEEYNLKGERPILREIDYYNEVIDKLLAGTKLYTSASIAEAKPASQHKSGEKEVAYRMWLGHFEEKLATKREHAFCQAAFSSGWDAAAKE